MCQNDVINTHIVDLLDLNIGICGQAEVLGLRLDYDQHRVGGEFLQLVIDGNVVLK
jgi:hypothetical protein